MSVLCFLESKFLELRVTPSWCRCKHLVFPLQGNSSTKELGTELWSRMIFYLLNYRGQRKEWFCDYYHTQCKCCEFVTIDFILRSCFWKHLSLNFKLTWSNWVTRSAEYFREMRMLWGMCHYWQLLWFLYIL